MLLILLLNHAKTEKKIILRTVMHRGFSIHNYTFYTFWLCVTESRLLFLFFLLYVTLKLKVMANDLWQ